LKVAGIDEAGRGSLIGPLVIAIFITNNLDELEALNLKDSKKLTSKQRFFYFKRLKEIGYFEIAEINPEIIDKENLNKLELEFIKKLVDKSAKKHNVKRFYIDLFTREKELVENSIKSIDDSIKVIAEYKADEKYPIVSAASIIAKVIRDREIKKMKKVFGDFGSGYPSDEKTIQFLKNNLEILEKSNVIRKKWKTYKRIKKLIDSLKTQPLEKYLHK
jgi:ribonuclease HII